MVNLGGKAGVLLGTMQYTLPGCPSFQVRTDPSCSHQSKEVGEVSRFFFRSRSVGCLLLSSSVQSNIHHLVDSWVWLFDLAIFLLLLSSAGFGQIGQLFVPFLMLPNSISFSGFLSLFSSIFLQQLVHHPVLS